MMHRLLAVSLLINLGNSASAAEPPPNIVLMFADDLGYGDLGCYGNARAKTPHLDQLARDGRKLTSFLVAQAVCSASRTALLTGCYPNRVGILGALGPGAKVGIADEETTLGEVLQSRGYATAIYGKWHLGDHPQFAPTRHGFDEYFGLPYSNDMWPRHPTAKFPDLPLRETDRTIALNPDQTQLTTWYTERTVQFIERNANRPFFVYVPHSMPHVPLFASDKYLGRTKHGLYQDVIAEIDWSMGQILAALERTGNTARTLVIFTSDNGPWLSYGNHGGVAGPLREGKGTAWEGGVRVPFLARWPGKIPAGTVSNQLAATVDVLPMLAKLTGAELPAKKLDGLDMLPVLTGDPQAPSPRVNYLYYYGQELRAVREERWKLVLPHRYISVVQPGESGMPGKLEQRQTGQALYDLDQDVGESKDVAHEHADIVSRLTELAEAARSDLGDSLTKRKGAHVRAAGTIAP